jgi:hypothetical protein
MFVHRLSQLSVHDLRRDFSYIIIDNPAKRHFTLTSVPYIAVWDENNGFSDNKFLKIAHVGQAFQPAERSGRLESLPHRF